VQAVILAGGLGTRLRPLTEQVPKVMLPVNGKPFLLHLLELLRSRGFDDLVLCIGYLGDQIRGFFQNGASLGVRIRYSEEKGRLLGTGGSLKQAQSLLDESFFVINGDTYLPIDYAAVERAFINCGKKALMVVVADKEDTGVRANVEVGDESLVIRYDKANPDPGLGYVEAGVLVLSRGTLDILEKGRSASLEEGLYPVLIRQRELAAYIATQRFYDIGTPQQLRTFEEYLRRRAG